MVGVPGKFKGCETCRRRRVPCDNERPFCRKCTKNGHDCEGYERPIMFITGTLEDKGRVSIHPKKPFSASAGVKKVRKPASPPRASPRQTAHTPTPTTPTATTLLPSPALSQPQSLPLLLRASPRRTGFGRGRLDIILAEPLTPAWDDILFLASRGAERIVRLAAMYARLDSVSKTESAADSGDFTVALPPYYPPDIHPRWQEGGGDFEVGSQCLLHLAPPPSPGGGEHSAAAAAVATPSTSICLFLFEQNSSMVQDNTMAPWKIPQSQLGSVRKLGPEYFRRFPNHHYFVRVFRPSAIMMAFMSRKDTFLCSAEWKTVPWEAHPKSIFDSLLDIVSFLPSIFGRTDRMIPAQPTLSRRLRAQDLLASCLSVEKQFDDWFVLASQGPTEDTYSYWIQEPSQTETRLPFADSFAFRDGILAVAFLYYWTAQIQFHQCIEALHRLIFQPVVVDDYHPHPHHHPHHPHHHHPAAAASYPPDLPPNLLINPVKYQQGREFAANICRALNFALSSTVQPDLLVAPLTVATDLYSQIHEASGGDGALELMWCDTLRGRLITKAEDMASVIQTKTWFELSRY